MSWIRAKSASRPAGSSVKRPLTLADAEADHQGADDPFGLRDGVGGQACVAESVMDAPAGGLRTGRGGRPLQEQAEHAGMPFGAGPQG